MKIAIVGTRGMLWRYSGIEVSVNEAAKCLGERGYKIVIYCRKLKNVLIPGYLCKNIKLVYIPTVNSKHLGTFIHAFFSTLHLIFSDIDIAHFHALGPSFFAFLPRLFGKKTIVTIHCLDWKRKKWKYPAKIFLKICEYTAIFFPHKTTVVSKTLKYYFEKKFRKNIYFIPNAVNINNPSQQEEGNIKKLNYMLFVGRLVPEKGIHHLIKAFNALDTDKELIIAGESSFTDDYAAYLRRMAGKNTKFLGFVGDRELDRLYRNAYIFILPSEVEGSSLSLLEAMSYGRCVVVSDIPECLEIIHDCGISFRCGDYLDLKDKLQYLIDNPDIVSMMGLKARRRISERYNWDIIIDELERLYLS